MNFEHQKVRLIAYTQWADIDIVGNEEDIISYCARVSNPSNQENFDTAERLLRYCIRKKHWSIFEMANVVFEINTTRDIGRQILRHRSFHFQEFSQRYANPTKEGLGSTLRQARLQDEKNRQQSLDIDQDSNTALDFYGLQDEVLVVAQKAYKNALDMGIAKEQARALLPEGLTMSRMYMNGTVRDWFHYCQLRMNLNETQREHVDIARKVWKQLLVLYPFLGEIQAI